MRTEMTDIWLPSGKNGLMIMVLSNRRSLSELNRLNRISYSAYCGLRDTAQSGA